MIARLKEYEHECEKCMASKCLWSSKGGNRYTHRTELPHEPPEPF